MLQLIVPLYNDPLLCELYFRNYAKYKQKHVDRLLICINSWNAVRQRETQTDYQHNISALLSLLDHLKIYNYVVRYNDSGHGAMINLFSDFIFEHNYDCYIDEQDVYWLHDNFGDHVAMLNNVDAIFGNFTTVVKNVDVDKFNIKYKVNHAAATFACVPLPQQFLSHRVIEKLQPFDASQSIKTVADLDLADVYAGNSNDIIHMDTMHLMNLEMYKHTDKIKLYENGEFVGNNPDSTKCSWSMLRSMYDKRCVNFDNHIDSVVYHATESRFFSEANLYKIHNLAYLMNVYLHCYLPEPDDSNRKYAHDLRNNFFYQSLSMMTHMQYQQQYADNFEKMKDYISLGKFNCKNLLKMVL